MAMTNEFNITLDLTMWQGRLAKLCARLGWRRLGEWAIRKLTDRVIREHFGGAR